ncbi:hypothetical protein MRB53_011949 [Persea americana]|uniref:Uncharacterized protein n=1 Tax=Persea americana TaxID=3435 RepID=A0ACC2LXK7_PERAE|nr:hypothetical protein MRB53_011949 [Persea americana]
MYDQNILRFGSIKGRIRTHKFDFRFVENGTPSSSLSKDICDPPSHILLGSLRYRTLSLSPDIIRPLVSLKERRDRGADGCLLISMFRVFAVTEGSAKSSKSDEKIPSWARPESDEPPPWARDEAKDVSGQTFEIPFYGYLLASAITAIAAIGSIFEYINQRPVFGVLNSDSVFYAPLLGFFAFTGVPTSAFLWFKSVQAANKASEEQDRRDGYL